VSRGTWIWPSAPSLRLIADSIEFCAREVPRFNAISVAGAHFRDAGANAVQEMAFTLADGVTYCDTVLARGRMTIDQFAPQISFFFYTHRDFFEEIAKYRAGRRRWATIVRERYGAETDKAAMFRFGCVAGGASLYAPQPHNNIIRVACEAMASALGGVQSMFTAAWDEPFAPRHRGISCFVISMHQPGVEQRPLKMISGVSTEFGQVRFDGARVPTANLVGAPGEGWKLAMTVVSHEREPSTLGFTARYDKTVRSLAARVAASGGEAAAAADAAASGAVPGTVPGDPTALGTYLYSRAQSVMGGTAQIQKNIIAARILGLG